MARAIRFVQNPGNTAIAYYRYSSDAQRDCSIDQQREAAQAYADKNGLLMVKEYPEPAMSGTRDDRPQFQLMLREVETLRPAYLIVWATDRISRDKIDSVVAKKRLRECGVKIVYLTEAIPEDDEATQVLMESVYEGMAEAFIIKHRKNVMRGLDHNAERALYNGSKLLGYKGVKDMPYEIDEETAPMVRKAFRDYVDGIPMKTICEEMNAAGLRTSQGNPFSPNSLHRILSNRRYIGEYKWGKHVIPDGMPRIIDDELFEAAARKMEANRHGGKGAVRKVNPDSGIQDFWLTGKVFCGLCGSSMRGDSGTSKTGTVYHYYACAMHKKRKCDMKNVPKRLLEEVVTHVLSELVSKPTLRLLIAEKCYAEYQMLSDDGGAYQKSIEMQIKEVDGKLKNILKAIEDGIYNETTSERMRELEERKRLLKDELTLEKIKRSNVLTKEQIVKYLDSLEGDITDIARRKEILAIFVDKIYIYTDRLSVVFNYTGDEEEFVYDDIANLEANRKNIIELLSSGTSKEADISEEFVRSLLGEEPPDFFG